MLCAQALALVAQALARLEPGEALDVRYNADDVRHDVLVWVKGRGYPAAEAEPGTLRLTKTG